MDRSVKEAIKDSLKILPGYMVLGIGFGVLLKTEGFGLLHAFLMSAFIYAGSMQYAAVDLLGSAASLISCFLMTVMVNIRHLFYGVGMLERYRKIRKHRIYDIFTLTDETFSLVCSKDMTDLDPDRYYFLLSLLDHLYWITGCLIGSLFGDILPFNSEGIGFSMTALFLTIVIGQWESSKDHLPVLLSFVISVLCLILIGKESFLLPAMVGIVLMSQILERIRGGRDA